MQTYTRITNEFTGVELPGKIDENLQSLKSHFSGTAFPTENLVVGMPCYRTDEKKVYRLMEDLVTWKLESDLNYANGVPIATQSEAEKGEDDTKSMTPLKVKQSILKNVPIPETMTGASDTSDGLGGFVPAPKAGDNKKVLHGDGLWKKAIGFESYWEANEAVKVGDTRFPYGRENSGYVLECVKAGVTGKSQPVLEGNVVEDEFNLNNFEGTLSIEKGGTGVKTIEDAKKVFGIDTVDRFPIGTILPFGGNEVPVGYLTCNGAAVSRTTYADLFAIIGTTYGAGNGISTFNLPNLGSNIVSDVSSGEVPVVGNGMTLGLKDGKGFRGLHTISGGVLASSIESYGSNIGEHSGVAITVGQEDVDVGITTDETKSGIVAKMSATKTTVKYIIKAFSSVTNAGNIDVQNLASDYERVNTEIANTKKSITGISDYIIESYRNGTEWYEVYKSGKVRQGGRFTVMSGTETLTLLKRYANTNFSYGCFPVEGIIGNDYSLWGVHKVADVDKIYFRIGGDQMAVGSAKMCWWAEGQGA